MKKIITIKMEVDTNHPAREEWQKQKDFVDTEIYVTLLVRIKKKSAKHQVRQPHIV